MSSCLIIQRHNDLYIGADTATSALLDGKFYRMNNNFQKIHLLNNAIAFIAGGLSEVVLAKKWLVDNNNPSPNDVSQFLYSCIGEPTKDGIFDLELLICEIENGQSIVRQYSQYNKFECVEHRVSEGNIQILTAGLKAPQLSDISTSLIIEGVELKEVYKQSFNKISCNEIGGTLQMFHYPSIEQIIDYPIEESGIEYVLKSFKEHSLVGDTLVGRVLAGNNLHIETAARGQGLNPQLIMDENGLRVNNANIEMTRIQGNITNRIVLNPLEGFSIFRGTQRTIFLDSNGDVNFIGHITGGSIGIGSGNGPGGSAFHVSSTGVVTITTGEIRLGGTSTNPNFRVDNQGNITIRQGSIDINNGRFSVDSQGNAVMQHATITGGSIMLGSTNITEAMFRTQNGQHSTFQNSNFDATNNIHGGAVEAGTLNASSIVVGSITAQQIQAGSITALQIQAGTITAEQIMAGSITGDRIAANQITTNHITASGISADVITSGTINANIIDVINLNANNITAGSISANRIQGGVLQGLEIVGGWGSMVELQVGGLFVGAPAIPVGDTLTDLLNRVAILEAAA